MTKNQFHSNGKKLLEQLAAKLCLAPNSFSIRSNRAGPAVLGEVILHSNNLYVMLGIMDDMNRALCRSCESQRDYCGGPNHYYPVDKLLTDDGLRFLGNVAR